MFSSRTSTARNVSRIARNFATVVDTAGVKVAAVDNGQPTASVTFLVKAGSRYESKPGVAHVLKNFAFKSTSKRSSLGTVRESELYGGVLTASLSREHLALTAEFLRGDEPFFVDLLSSFITSGKFLRHEYQEVVAPVVEAESSLASTDPITRAIELAHTVAFRSGLGSSLFASPHHPITVDDIKSYAASVFGKNNIAVLGTGIDQSTLSKLVEASLSSASSASATSSSPSSYFGGETRVESHGGPQTVFIGFGSSGPIDPALPVISAHLSPAPSVKWSQGLSPIAPSVPAGTTVQTVLLPYSDATLFGLLVQGPTSQDVREAAQASVTAIKEIDAVKGDDLKKAIAKAKFAAASALDAREGFVSSLGAKVLAGSESTTEAVLSSFDKVDASTFSKAASSLFKVKPTFVAVGDIQTLPYADELGL